MVELQDIIEMTCGEVVREFEGRPMSASRNLLVDLNHAQGYLADTLLDQDNWYLSEMNTRDILYVVADGKAVDPGSLTLRHFNADYHTENLPKEEEIDRFNQR